MTDSLSYTAFAGDAKLCSGPPASVAMQVKAHLDAHTDAVIMIFNDDTGRPLDLDLRGTATEIAARYAAPERPRGRPRLGVVGREVTLLPRQWDWLNAQPGGASVALRKLIDEARRQGTAEADKRQRRDAAYSFMSAMAGNRPQFEEAARALFADDMARFHALISIWPADIRRHIADLAGFQAVFNTSSELA